ncbi:MAG: PP2C family protein-serine/threonine phosphatase [Armatimonadota bacterium]|nr:serine/threonine-protein phosphatase [bacterium]
MISNNKALTWLKKPIPALVISIILLGFVALADYLTGPLLDLSILYFLSIVYAAWALGRFGALAAVAVAVTQTITDQFTLVRIGHWTSLEGALHITVMLAMYLFIGEVTVRFTGTNQRLRSTYALLDDDLNAAGLLQANILEIEKPDIPSLQIGVSVRYAGRTGGDFADAGRVNGKIYACIADVAGKGTPAALFTTLLKHLLTDAHRKGLRAADAIAEVNAALCRMLTAEKFVTMFYLEIDPATGMLEYVNAGHPEGLVHRAATNELVPLRLTSPLLGLLDMPSGPCSCTFKLEPGDSLTIYSDGATDSRARTGGHIGDALIHELASEYAYLDAQDMADAISDEIIDKAVEDKRDDLAIICIKLVDQK